MAENEPEKSGALDQKSTSGKKPFLQKYWKETAAGAALVGAGFLANIAQRPQAPGLQPPAPVVIPAENQQQASARYERIVELENLMSQTRDPMELDVYARLHQSEHVLGMRNKELPERLANNLMQESARQYNQLQPIEDSVEGHYERLGKVQSFLKSIEEKTNLPTPDIDLGPSYRQWDNIKRELNPHEEILIAGGVLEPEGMSRPQWNKKRDFAYVRDYEDAQGYMLKRKIEELSMQGELKVVADQSVIDAVELIKNPNPRMRNTPLAITAGVVFNPFNPEPSQLMQDLGHVKVTAENGETLTIRLNLMQGMKVMQGLMENSDPKEWKTPNPTQKIEMQRAADAQLDEVAPYLGGQLPGR